MRDHEVFVVDAEVFEQQQVDVERPRRVPGRVGLAPEGVLDLLARREQVSRSEPSLHLDGHVVEVALAGGVVHRLGLVERGRADGLDLGVLVEQRHPEAYVPKTVADVGAEAEKGSAQRSTSTDTSSTGSGIGGSGLVARTTTFAALKRSSNMSATAVQRRSSVR